MNRLRARLKIRHIQVVLAIAEMGNLLRAAQSLNITQPAISKALSEAEDVAGERLFERTPFGTKPTRAGKALIQHGRRMLSELDHLRDVLEAIKRGEGDVLRVGLYSLIADWSAIVTALHRIRSEASGLSLTIENGTMEDLIARLDAGHLDVIVGRYPYATQQQRHVVRGLVVDHVVAVVRKGHPALALRQATLANLISYDWILPPETNMVRTQFETQLAEANLSLAKTPISSLATPTNLRLVTGADFIMLLPSGIAAELQSSGTLDILPISMPVGMGPLVAVWGNDHERDSLLVMFADLLSEEILVS